MKLKHKVHGHIGYSSEFNMHGLGEMIVFFEEGDASSESISDYDVLIDDKWIDMNEAFKSGLLVEDEFGKHFRAKEKE